MSFILIYPVFKKDSVSDVEDAGTQTAEFGRQWAFRLCSGHGFVSQVYVYNQRKKLLWQTSWNRSDLIKIWRKLFFN